MTILMRVLGIDPGSQIMGIGILDSKGNEARHVFSESLRLPKGDLAPRLAKIFQRLDELIAEYKPDIMALEKVFLAKNPQAALTLGHARGAAMLAGVNSGLDIAEYSATQIKKTFVGRGRGDKGQVQHMIRIVLSLRFTPEVDASDALACALCHVHQRHAQSNIERNSDLASRMKFQ
jgi:crossover junction endodeoxyribonuclease RuvC